MTASAWTTDHIERLTALWREGKTAAQVAHELGEGITRSAVLGKVHRMGLSHGRAAQPIATGAQPRPGGASSPGRISVDRPPSVFRDALEETGRASILTVRTHECRWPLGDPRSPAFSLCGRLALRGPYCGSHAHIAYRSPSQTAGSLERLAGL